MKELTLDYVSDLIKSVEVKSVKLKDIKAEHQEILGSAKSFAQAECILKDLYNTMQKADEELAEQNHQVAEQEAVAMKTFRDEMKEEIIELLTEQGKATFGIAARLAEVKEDFDNGTDFLAWCKQELSLAKASVYNYLKLDKTFGSKPEFRGVAVRVLNELSRYKYLADIIDDAEVFASRGELDTKRCMDLIDANEEKRNPKPEPKPESNDETVTEPEKPELPQSNVLDSTPLPEPTNQDEDDDDDIPFDTSVGTQMQANDAVQEANEDTVPSSELEAMQKQLEALTEQLAEANKTIARLTENTERTVKNASAPSLPQFKNACLYARLGLGQVEAKDKAVVRKAFRDLVGLGYGVDHKDHGLIKYAFEELSK